MLLDKVWTNITECRVATVTPGLKWYINITIIIIIIVTIITIIINVVFIALFIDTCSSESLTAESARTINALYKIHIIHKTFYLLTIIVCFLINFNFFPDSLI